MSIKSRIKKRLYGAITANEIISLRDKICSDSGRGINRIIKTVDKIRYSRITKKVGAFIPVDCSLGYDLVFPHGLGGIYISSGAKVGNQCVIFHQVTIGSNTLPDSKGKGFPVIGNNVYIGAGAKIIGGVKVGNYVRIGANCVITNDVPDNTTVVLPKPVFIPHDEPLVNTFIPYKEHIRMESIDPDKNMNNQVQLK